MRRQNHSRMNRAARAAVLFSVFAIGASLAAVAADEYPLATLRNSTIKKQPAPPAIPKVNNTDLRQARNYPEQPPVIPHTIRGYQIDLNSNKCLTCHSRKATEESQAPMVSVTHFMDRDGQVRTSVSPRRFFCTQCHVTQKQVKPLTENTFVDVDAVISSVKKKGN